MLYIPSGLFDRVSPTVQWLAVAAIILGPVGGFVYGVTRPIPPDFSTEARNNWISECTGSSRGIDDCSMAWDKSRTLRSIYIESAAKE